MKHLTLYQRKFIDYEYSLKDPAGRKPVGFHDVIKSGPLKGMAEAADKKVLSWGYRGEGYHAGIGNVGIYRAVACVAANELPMFELFNEDEPSVPGNGVLVLGERFGANSGAVVLNGRYYRRDYHNDWKFPVAVLAAKEEDLGLAALHFTALPEVAALAECDTSVLAAWLEANGSGGILPLPEYIMVRAMGAQGLGGEIGRLKSFFGEDGASIVFAPHFTSFATPGNALETLKQVREVLAENGVIGITSASHCTVFPAETPEQQALYYFNHSLQDAFWTSFAARVERLNERRAKKGLAPLDADTNRNFKRGAYTKEALSAMLREAGYAVQEYFEALLEVPEHKIAASCELGAILRLTRAGGLNDRQMESLISASLGDARKQVPEESAGGPYVERLMIITAGAA